MHLIAVCGHGPVDSLGIGKYVAKILKTQTGTNNQYFMIDLCQNARA